MPINLKPKRQPLAKRLERRARIVSLLKTWIPRLSVALYFVGLGWLLLLPHDQYNKETYVSENALLPAQINVYYGFSDINVAKEYQSKIEERLNQSSLEKARFIETELRAAGFRATIQKFSSPIPHPDDVQGVNAFGIYHAPRSDGTESLVLSAPWVSRDGRDNINGISLLLSVARMFKRHTYWSKDIIILVTDDGLAGTQAWLDVYHGEQGSHMYPVMPRAGAIQAAVNLDFPGTSEYDSLGIFFEGVNGQLPNLDLVNTVVRVARVTSQIPVTLHDVPEAALRGVAESLGSYFASLSNMLYTMRYQALGHPTGDHGLYLRYKIDAITLYGVPATSGATFGFHRIGALIESTFRSLNNLLEHFHQSFFFYFLSDQERYVSIGMYMPPVILFACSLVFDSLVLWGSSTIPVATGSSNPEQDKDARPQVPFPYSTSRRELAPAFAVLVLAHAAGVLVFFVMRPAFTVWGETWVGDGAILLKLTIVVLISAFAPIGSTILIRRAATTPAVSNSAWRVLKSLSLAYAAMSIVAVSPTNFSLSIVTALIVTLPFLALRPTASRFGTVVQAALLAALSPPGLLLLVAVVSGTSIVQAVRLVLVDYEMVGTWVLMYVCCMYWPVNVALWGVVFGEV